jgi:hypothetical protein
VGNTNPSVRDNPLDIVSEPENGWSSIEDATETRGKTQVWKCKKHPNHPVQCYCINLDSFDSPNSAFPIDRPRWVHMAGPHKTASYTVGSESYWSNGRGVFKFGLDQFKIITREVCDQFHAFDEVIWEGGEPTIKIGSLDSAYGHGDRCCLGWQEFGKCSDGKIRLLFRDHWLVPITLRKGMTPEDQISDFCKEKMEAVGVAPENFFFDGRGTMAMSLAARWSAKVNAIEFGGSPTERPAGPDLYTQDKTTGQRRLKLAKEHFSKFVTELWWSWRYAIESDQIRGTKLEVVLDAQPREWYKVAGDKIEIEVKRDMKKRTGISPDLADMACTGIEGARRRGFSIEKIGNKMEQKKRPNLLEKDSREFRKIQAGKQLQTA